MMYAKVELYRDDAKLLQYTIQICPYFTDFVWDAPPGEEFVDPGSDMAVFGIRIKALSYPLSSLRLDEYGADEANGAACRAMANALRRRDP